MDWIVPRLSDLHRPIQISQAPVSFSLMGKRKMLLAAGILVLLLIVSRQRFVKQAGLNGPHQIAIHSPEATAPIAAHKAEPWRRIDHPTEPQPATEIVQEKVAKFGQSRR